MSRFTFLLTMWMKHTKENWIKINLELFTWTSGMQKDKSAKDIGAKR